MPAVLGRWMGQKCSFPPLPPSPTGAAAGFFAPSLPRRLVNVAKTSFPSPLWELQLSEEAWTVWGSQLQLIGPLANHWTQLADSSCQKAGCEAPCYPSVTFTTLSRQGTCLPLLPPVPARVLSFKERKGCSFVPCPILNTNFPCYGTESIALRFEISA